MQKFTFGIGDRFAHQAIPQLKAFQLARAAGADIVPVWNKSNREHTIIGSDPADTRAAADAAVRARDWRQPYYLDADHITLETVDRFVQPCDFFTLDVADQIGKPADPDAIANFIRKHPELTGNFAIDGIDHSFQTTRADIELAARKFLRAIHSAAAIYHRIAEQKGPADFVTEISMDETDQPQSPAELLVILAAVADCGIPVQTIAPKFTGRFNKGVDYVGDPAKFEQEFSDDIAIIAHAIKAYALPESLKLSVHSGSDKFSLYTPIRNVLARTGAGIHLKTAGTTWLEELIGLAEAGGEALKLTRQIYQEAFLNREDLCAPYATVIDIDAARLPNPRDVAQWTGEQFANALRHNPDHPAYNPHLRQLLHVAFKIAAELGETYRRALKENAQIIGKNVTQNLFERHLKPLFL